MKFIETLESTLQQQESDHIAKSFERKASRRNASKGAAQALENMDL